LVSVDVDVDCADASATVRHSIAAANVTRPSERGM
jgi:hypothetical protein